METAVLVLERDWQRPREVVEIAGRAVIGCHGDDLDLQCRNTIATLAYRDGAWWLEARELEVTIDDTIVRGEIQLRHGQRIGSTRGRAVRFLIGDRERVLDELRHVETIADPMTGLLNRRTIRRALEDTAFDQVSMIDIDWLKRINDHYGMLAGNLAIVRTAALLRAHVAWPDLVARFGGEEFVILHHGTLDQTRALAEQLRAAAAVPFDYEGEPITATLSIGIQPRLPTGGLPTLAAADENLALAKTTGRNRVVG